MWGQLFLLALWTHYGCGCSYDFQHVYLELLLEACQTFWNGLESHQEDAYAHYKLYCIFSGYYVNGDASSIGVHCSHAWFQALFWWRCFLSGTNGTLHLPVVIIWVERNWLIATNWGFLLNLICDNRALILSFLFSFNLGLIMQSLSSKNETFQVLLDCNLKTVDTRITSYNAWYPHVVIYFYCLRR